ncbi:MULTISPECIES: alpha/beta hydrolase [Flavobacteriaceae]|nr:MULTISPECIES: alpha/beta hydrolase [Flavobacteriaceae]WJJ95715.1 alpha/beta hydrolase [Algibacter luteus]
MNILKHSLLLTLLLIIASCTEEGDLTNSISENELLDYKELLNLSYGESSNQTYDIYLPEGRNEDTKVIILVHGGGWNSGDKSSMLPLINLYKVDFPEVALVNINYRLSDEDNPPYPMQINDITTIVDDLKSKKDDYVISNEYGFLGISAGGHLSLLWSYSFDIDNNVKMVASIVGPTNFTDPAYLNNTNPILQELLDSYGVNTTISFLEEVSPVHQAKTTSPPTIHFYGGQDPLIPVSQGTNLRDKLNSLNVNNDYTLYPDAGHGWGGTELLDTWSKLKTFTETQLL